MVVKKIVISINGFAYLPYVVKILEEWNSYEKNSFLSGWFSVYNASN